MPRHMSILDCDKQIHLRFSETTVHICVFRAVAIASTAFSVLIGWPFAALLSLPIILDLVVIQCRLREFLWKSLAAGVPILVMLYHVDSYHFGKVVVAPWNIIAYNLLTGPGPTLNGQESFLYFFNNLFINWNEKPQKTNGIGADNSIAPFSTKLKEKHHAIGKRSGIVVLDDDESGKRQWSSAVEETEEEHPYVAEIMHFKVPADQIKSSEPKKFKPLNKTELTMVDTKEKLEALKDKLNSLTEFSVDLEHNETRSYLGLTCLIQISTRDEDFVVDPFPIWEHVGILNEPFTNPNILKVLHGSDNDVLWLQRDFGIHIVNMFDTYVAMKKLKYPKFGLAYLVLRFWIVWWTS